MNGLVHFRPFNGASKISVFGPGNMQIFRSRISCVTFRPFSKYSKSASGDEHPLGSNIYENQYRSPHFGSYRYYKTYRGVQGAKYHRDSDNFWANKDFKGYGEFWFNRDMNKYHNYRGYKNPSDGDGKRHWGVHESDESAGSGNHWRTRENYPYSFRGYGYENHWAERGGGFVWGTKGGFGRHWGQGTHKFGNHCDFWNRWLFRAQNRAYRHSAHRGNSLHGSKMMRLFGRFSPSRGLRLLKFKHQRRQQRRDSSTWSRYNKHYGNSNWDRLKGPALFTLAFCVGTTLGVPLLMKFTPLGILTRNPSWLIYSIIAANGLVFLMWKNPNFITFMSRYGLLVKDKMYSNWSLLGSAFSHQSFMHIFVNMFVLQSFGTSLCAMLGATNFLVMYLNSAVIASFVSILVPTLMRTSLAVGSLGASGAVFSVVGAFSYLIPKAPIALFFIPVPGGAWFAFLGAIAYNAAGLFFRWGAYDYAAHLGGSMAGVAYGWYYTKKMREQRARARTIRPRGF